MQNKPTTPQPTTSPEGFPSWRYGPDEQSKVCASAAEVPEGWVDHPSKVGLAEPKLTKAEKAAAAKAAEEAELQAMIDEEAKAEEF